MKKKKIIDKLNENGNNYPTSRLSTITKITIYDNVKIDNDEKVKLLVIEEEYKPYIILDINYGLSISPLDIINNEIKNAKSKRINLYELDKDFQSDINFGEVSEVKLYKEATLINKINNEEVCKENIIEFKDYNDKCFYVDYINNDIYKRENLYRIKKYRKIIMIFKRHEELNININIFNSIYIKISKKINKNN